MKRAGQRSVGLQRGSGPAAASAEADATGLTALVPCDGPVKQFQFRPKVKHMHM